MKSGEIARKLRGKMKIIKKGTDNVKTNEIEKLSKPAYLFFI